MEMLLLILIAITVCLFLVLIVNRGFHDFYSPQVLLTLFFLLFYIFPGFWFIKGEDLFSKEIEPFFIGGRITALTKIYAIILAFLAFAFLIAGIYFVYWLHSHYGHRRIFTGYKIHWYGYNFILVLSLYISTGILLTGFLINILGGVVSIFYKIGGKFDLLSGKYVFTTGHIFLGVASTLLLFRYKRITFLFLLVLFLAIFSVFLLVNRGIIFILLLTLFLSYNYYIRSIRINKAIIYGLLGLLIGVSYKVFQVFIQSNFNLITLTNQWFWRYYWTSIWGDVSSDILIGPQQLSLVLKSVPSLLGYQNGKTLFGFPLTLVPKAFFPDKPLVSGAGIFTQNLFSNIGCTTIPPGFVGELYMNFSTIGVVLGMFTSGLFLGEIYWKMKHQHSIFMIFLYSYSLSFFMYLLRGEFLIINNYIFFVLLFWFALRFSGREKWLLRK